MQNRFADRTMTKKRMELIQKLGQILTQCYNGNIQNYGPGGIYEDSGRSFRYPVRGEGARMKVDAEPTSEQAATFLNAYCAFGANSMPIYDNIAEMLHHLETEYGLKIDTKS